MASNKFFFNDNSSSSEESSDDEQQVQVVSAKGKASKPGAKAYVDSMANVISHPRFLLFRSAPKPYLAMSDDEEDVKRVVRSEKTKRYIGGDRPIGA